MIPRLVLEARLVLMRNATMKVILLADIYKQGVAGEVIEVANGYARNYLIPKRMAVQATEGEMKRVKKLREAAEARRLQYEGMLNELGRKIDGTEIVFFRRAANTGKLFGSVTTQEIADELNRLTSVDINRRRISQQGIRDTGVHVVPVRLGTDVSPVLNVVVIAEEERIEFERQRKAVAEGLLESIRFDRTGHLIVQKIAERPVVKEEAPVEAMVEESLPQTTVEEESAQA
jgi:large subunit ribosomal protein L9